MAGKAPAEQPALPAAMLAHNLPFPPGAHAFRAEVGPPTRAADASRASARGRCGGRWGLGKRREVVRARRADARVVSIMAAVEAEAADPAAVSRRAAAALAVMSALARRADGSAGPQVRSRACRASRAAPAIMKRRALSSPPTLAAARAAAGVVVEGCCSSTLFFVGGAHLGRGSERGPGFCWGGWDAFGGGPAVTGHATTATTTTGCRGRA
jgi:hypothetical protein